MIRRRDGTKPYNDNIATTYLVLINEHLDIILDPEFGIVEVHTNTPKLP